MNFPTLSIGPEYPLKATPLSPILRSESERGYVVTRPRYSRIRYSWTISYRVITDADRALMEQFLLAVGYGAVPFIYTMPDTSETKLVRFARDTIPEISTDFLDQHSFTMTIEEV